HHITACVLSRKSTRPAAERGRNHQKCHRPQKLPSREGLNQALPAPTANAKRQGTMNSRQHAASHGGRHDWLGTGMRSFLPNDFGVQLQALRHAMTGLYRTFLRLPAATPSWAAVTWERWFARVRARGRFVPVEIRTSAGIPSAAWSRRIIGSVSERLPDKTSETRAREPIRGSSSRLDKPSCSQRTRIASRGSRGSIGQVR